MKSALRWLRTAVEPGMRALHGRWIRPRVDGGQPIWSRLHFSYYGIIPNHCGDLPTDGPHDRLRLEGTFFVSRFKSLSPSRLFHITADWDSPFPPALPCCYRLSLSLWPVESRPAGVTYCIERQGERKGKNPSSLLTCACAGETDASLSALPARGNELVADPPPWCEPRQGSPPYGREGSSERAAGPSV